MTLPPFLSSVGLPFAILLAGVALYELFAVFPLRLRVRRLTKETELLAKALDRVRVFAEASSGDRKNLRAQLARLEEKIAQLNLRTDDRPYEQAITLAEHGAEGLSLSRTLGLSRDEAELGRLLHGGRGRETDAERRR